MKSRLKAVGAYSYDFVVGDDWRVAVGVVVVLLATWAVSAAGGAAWWCGPVGVALLLPASLRRAIRSKP